MFTDLDTIPRQFSLLAGVFDRRTADGFGRVSSRHRDISRPEPRDAWDVRIARADRLRDLAVEREARKAALMSRLARVSARADQVSRELLGVCCSKPVYAKGKCKRCYEASRGRGAGVSL